MGRPDRCCIFCGRDHSLRGKEHVVPLWLQRHMGIKARVFANKFNRNLAIRGRLPPGAFAAYESRVNRKHAFSAFVNGRVCGPCNSGWMSALEVAAEPDLVALMSGELPLSGLSDERRVIVARWIAKTAYAWYFAFTDFQFVPELHPREFKARGFVPPDGVFVYAKQMKVMELTDHYISNNWWIPMKRPASTYGSPRGPVAIGYKISYQIGDLHMMVAYMGTPYLRIVPKRGEHTQIHPPGAPDVEHVNEIPARMLMSLPHLGNPNAHQLFHLALIVSDLTPGDLKLGATTVNFLMRGGP